MLAAGDIASCLSDGDEATAALLDLLEGIVLALGDTVYESGSPDEFVQCYAPTWGRHVFRTRPAPGNHDYGTPGAAGYFGYFGAAAGDAARGYYSFDVGSWHAIALNSNCAAVGGCDAGSAQEKWLREDLAHAGARCTLAYWHHTFFSSGPHGSDQATLALFQALYEAGAEIVLTGHDHLYERFSPQSPAADIDLLRGIRVFVVGTGGRSSYGVERGAVNSERTIVGRYGLLSLTLGDDSYEWRFLATPSGDVLDRGSGRCH